MMTTIRLAVVPLALLLTANAAVLGDSPRGIGILGDSFSDEYQFYPPDRSTARNWVEILATTRGLDFGRFDVGGHGEPRNQGYAFNWARSGATTEDLIRTGQHTGVAAQVTRGEVGIVVIFIGGNDFINAVKGSNPTAGLAAALSRAQENHRTAVRTILAASPRVKLVLGTLPDVRHLPEFEKPLRDGRLSAALVDACTDAIGRYNAHIRTVAASEARIALIDLDLVTRAVTFLRPKYVVAAGRRLALHHAANTHDSLFLADGRHPSTLGQGLMACMFIEVVNRKFAAGIRPLEPRELLAVGGSVASAPAGSPNPVRWTEVTLNSEDVRRGAGRSGASYQVCTTRPTLLWLSCWIIALWNYERGAGDATDWMKPPYWSGNFWGPLASRARLAGQLPPLPLTPPMVRWNRWGRSMLREGDIVFRLGDARTLRGIAPLSQFIAGATGSPFSHTGIVAIEDGLPVVYDCSSEGVQRQPFEVWMLGCVGAMGVKRLKPEHRRHIPGVIGYCRKVYDQQVPFDYEFRMDDSALYCLELTEKAFRSQGLMLSEPVRIGDWEQLGRYPLTALAIPVGSRMVFERPITLEQPVYVPGNERQGVWASPLLETVFGPEPKVNPSPAPGRAGGFNLRGDLEVAVFALRELRRSYFELPVRWMCEVALQRRIRGLFAAPASDVRRGGAEGS